MTHSEAIRILHDMYDDLLLDDVKGCYEENHERMLALQHAENVIQYRLNRNRKNGQRNKLNRGK